ncbi:SET domain-containing protein-lysine N-methyltransferase [Streptomyces noursei]|uniref:SET domain-containing protein-lysine N-methyltransferase n=1 Tax=Streptomyces noursei TaxID=1971 RepID=UPI00344E6D3D
MSNSHGTQLTVERNYRTVTGLAVGSGLVAGAVIEEGAEIMTLSDCVPAEATKYTIQVERGKHVIGTDIRFLNHSCDPSTYVDAAAGNVVATRRLVPGDELTFFYPSTEWEMASPFTCACAAPGCVGKVTGAAFLAVDVLKGYRINAHIQELLAERDVEPRS